MLKMTAVHILNIILFFTYLYGLGYTLTRFIKNNNFETILIRLGVGLGLFPVLGIFLNTLKIPLDWRIFLVLSLAVPFYDLIRNLKNLKLPRFKIDTKVVLLLLILIVSLMMYCGGPFQYPWLEDDDSWRHAASIKYIAVEKNLNAASGIFQYINPYPPGYDLLLGMMHQTSPSMYWTLKFFNGLIISLGILFFFSFARQLTQNSQKAILATFFLAAIPCYLSHFIWAHSLVVTLFFPAFYAILKSSEDKRFLLPASLIVAGIFVTQPTQSIKFIILLFLLVAAVSIVKKKCWKEPVIIGIVAILVSLLWWGPVFMKMATGSLKLAMRTSIQDLGNTEKTAGFLRDLFSPEGGTATRAYALNDYLFAPEHNMINNPTGIGIQLCILALIGIVLLLRYLKKRGEEENNKIYAMTVLLWLIFTFLGLNSKTFHLPMGLVAFRFWMLLAIPISLLAAESIYGLMAFIQRPLIRAASVFLLISSVLFTSGYSKFDINTTVWPWGVDWGSREELMGYIWMRKNLKKNTKVFAFTDNLFVIGNDMHADYWSEAYQSSFNDAIHMDADKLHAALKKNQFQYIVVGQREVKEFGVEVVNKNLKSLRESHLFEFVHGAGKGARIYRVLSRNRKP